MIGERFGLYVHCSGSINVVQLGFDSQDLRQEIRRALGGGGIKAERTSDELLYISLVDAYKDGRPRNDAASYFADISIFGDCIILPKSARDDPLTFDYKEAHDQCCLMHWDWQFINKRSKRHGQQNHTGGTDAAEKSGERPAPEAGQNNDGGSLGCTQAQCKAR